MLAPECAECGANGPPAARPHDLGKGSLRWVDLRHAVPSNRNEPPACSKTLSGNVLVFKFVGYRLIFVGHPPQAHLQGRVAAVAS